MNRRILRMAALVLAAGLSGTAQAMLHDRGGGLIYDDVLNVTWLADANLAATIRSLSSIYEDGSMKRDIADIWITGLNHDNHLGFNDWRLPEVTFSSFEVGIGYIIQKNEMGHLFSELGGVPGSSIFTTHNANLSLFQNIQSGFYWSSWFAGTGTAWTFSFINGVDNANYGSQGYAMLLRDGDVAAIPEPETYAMLLAGLGLLGIRLQSRKATQF